METSETPSQPKESSKPKKKKTKAEPTMYDKKYNWLKNRWWFVYPAIFVVIAGTISLTWKYCSDGAHSVQNFAGEIKSFINLTNTTKSRVMKDADGKVLVKKIEKMYEDIMYDRFKAANYFAAHVDRYILVNNLVPRQIDSLYRKNARDFVSPNAEVQDTAFYFAREEGRKTLEFWIHMNVFRNSKAKYETCDVKVQFVFNDQNQILAYNELKIRNLKYSAEKG